MRFSTVVCLYTSFRLHLLTVSLCTSMLLSWIPLYAGEIIISGIYQGKNLFVQNPLSSDAKTYCANEVFVNDQKIISEVKVAAFEVDLSYLEINEPVTIRITHKDGCAPRLINPQVVRPSAGFQIEKMEVSLNHIRWNTVDENPKFVYYVESLRNGNWIVIEKLMAKEEGKGIYLIPIIHATGDNKYRIKAQNTQTHQTFYSRTITFNPDTDPVIEPTSETITFSPEYPKDQLLLSKEVAYEIIDSQKKIIIKGKGQIVNIKALKAGIYYLKVAEQTEKFVKR